jgi:hypothetical protein
VAQALGRTVDWDNDTQTVYISGEQSTPPTAIPTPAEPANPTYFEDSLTGPLNANWTTSGSVQSLGERGLLLRGAGESYYVNEGRYNQTTETNYADRLVMSKIVLPEDCWDYTAEFELNIPGDMRAGTWVMLLLSERYNISKDEYVKKDYALFLADGTYIWDYENDYTKSDTAYKRDTYHKIKIDVNAKKADLFMDGTYLTSRALAGDKSTLAFRTDGWADSGYIVRNFKLTVKK